VSSRKRRSEERRPETTEDILTALRSTKQLIAELKDYVTQARVETRQLIREARPRPLMQLVEQFRPLRLIRKRVLGQGDGGNDRAG
jgi:hypothetical protein